HAKIKIQYPGAIEFQGGGQALPHIMNPKNVSAFAGGEPAGEQRRRHSWDMRSLQREQLVDARCNPVVTDWLAGYQAGKIRIFSVVTVRGVKMIEDKRWCGKWAGGQIALLLGPRFLTAMLQTDEKQTSPLRTLLPTVTPAEDHPE